MSLEPKASRIHNRVGSFLAVTVPVVTALLVSKHSVLKGVRFVRGTPVVHLEGRFYVISEPSKCDASLTLPAVVTLLLSLFLSEIR